MREPSKRASSHSSEKPSEFGPFMLVQNRKRRYTPKPTRKTSNVKGQAELSKQKEVAKSGPFQGSRFSAWNVERDDDAESEIGV